MEKFEPSSYEEKWRKLWEEKQIYKTDEDSTKEKAYILDMYPYPSGAGLHVGHPRGYLGTDVMARFERMRGKSVLHPMGFDSFGLPAENYAIKTGVHPQKTTDESIVTFKKQIEKIGLSYDWSKELSSHDPEYYKWTQWLFLQFYKKGLAYKKKAPVNWCPSCNTVLANEQVIDGKCERCDTEVIQKDMEQWFFKITDYADRLIEGLDRIDWPQSTKLGQLNWIGKSEGARIRFKVKGERLKETLMEVFSTAHDTIYGATFLVVAPENKFVKENIGSFANPDEIKAYVEQAKSKTELERQQQKDKTGVEIKGIVAINPANNKEIPIYVADYVLNGYGTGSIMAVPGQDERDMEFAKKYNLPIIFTTNSNEFVSYSNEIKKNPKKYTVTNSAEFDGLTYAEAREKMMKKFEEEGFVSRETNYRLRDWLVSRQRYWGAPIPIVYDPEGNAHAVDEKDLPVLIPTDVDFKPTGESPLNYSESFHKSAEEKYGKGWRREVDTMDTFVDSSWYFFRFTDVNNQEVFASSEKMNKYLPVDLYVGGAEHTVLHLLYARFFTKVLFDMGYVNFDEPFYKMRHQGMILAEDNRKMSKRWGNVINPDGEIEKYGADTLRIYEMFMGPFDSTMPWSTKTEIGVFRFLSKVWDLQFKVSADYKSEQQEREAHKLIKKVTYDIENMSFNTAVAKMMEFVNFLVKEGSINKSVWERFLIILAPMGPYVTEELWNRAGNEFSIHNQIWPSYDEAMTVDETVTIAVQFNGKLRGTVGIKAGAVQEDVIQAVKADSSFNKYLESEPKKVIYVQDRILNFIV
jgi:leucyl-tRNA synthetase